MKTQAYTIKRLSSNEKSNLFFDEAFFTFIEDELKQIEHTQHAENLRKHIHQKVISALAKDYFNSFPFLISRILKLSNGIYQVLILDPPQVFHVKINLQTSSLFKTSETPTNEEFIIEEANIELPEKLNPTINESVYLLLKDYIGIFESQKNKQHEEYQQGQRYVIFNAEKEPDFIAPIKKEDVAIETVASCVPQLEELLRQQIELNKDQRSFAECRTKIEDILKKTSNDKELRNYVNQQLLDCHLNQEYLNEKANYFDSKQSLVNDIFNYFNNDEVLKTNFLDYITTTQYLNFFKNYLAWTLHFSACSYHSLIQAETENDKRNDKINTFKLHFASIVDIDNEGTVPSLDMFDKAFNADLAVIAEKINAFLKLECNTSYFISSDKQKILVKNISNIATTIESKMKSYPYLASFIPFTSWTKGWLGLASAGFKWTKEAEELEKHNKTLLQAILNRAEKQQEYKGISQIYTNADANNFIEFTNSFARFYSRYISRFEILQKQRQEKKNDCLKNAEKLLQSAVTTLNQCKSLAADLKDQFNLEFLIKTSAEIKQLFEKIKNCELEKIYIGFKKKGSNTTDILDQTLAKLTTLSTSLKPILIDLQSKYKKNAYDAAQHQITEANNLCENYHKQLQVSLQRIHDNGLMLSALIDAPFQSLDKIELAFESFKQEQASIQEKCNALQEYSPKSNHDCYLYAEDIRSKSLELKESLQKLTPTFNQITVTDAKLCKATAIHKAQEEYKALQLSVADVPELTSHIEEKNVDKATDDFNVITASHSISKLLGRIQKLEETIATDPTEELNSEEIHKIINEKIQQIHKVGGKIKAIHQQILQFDKKLSLNEAKTTANNIAQEAKRSADFCQNFKLEFNTYLASADPRLANKIPVSTLITLANSICPLINNYLLEMEKEIKAINEFNIESTISPNQFAQHLDERLTALRKLQHHIYELEYSFILKIYASSCDQAKFVRNFLQKQLNQLQHIHNPNMIAKRKRFNEIALDIENVSRYKKNADKNLVGIIQDIEMLNALLVELHQMHAAIQNQHQLIIQQQQNNLLQQRRRDQPQVQRGTKKGARTVTALVISYFFTATLLLSTGIIGLIGSAGAALGLLIGSSAVGGLLGVGIERYSNKLLQKISQNPVVNFIQKHANKFKWLGVGVFAAVSVTSFIGLSFASVGFAPVLIGTFGGAMAASLTAITGASIGPTWGAILSLGFLGGWSAITATAIARTDTPRPVPSSPMNAATSHQANVNNERPVANDDTIGNQLTLSNIHTTTNIQQSLQKQEHLRLIEADVSHSSLIHQKNKVKEEKLDEHTNSTRIKKSNSFSSLFKREVNELPKLKRVPSAPSSFRM